MIRAACGMEVGTPDSAAPHDRAAARKMSLYAAGYSHAAPYKVYSQIPIDASDGIDQFRSGCSDPSCIEALYPIGNAIEIGNIHIAGATPGAATRCSEMVHRLVIYKGVDGIRASRFNGLYWQSSMTLLRYLMISR